jgi:hypothetical protein
MENIYKAILSTKDCIEWFKTDGNPYSKSKVLQKLKKVIDNDSCIFYWVLSQFRCIYQKS